MALTTIYRPLILDPVLGAAAGAPDGAIFNIGGVTGPTFTVGGKELLFADGTGTGGGNAFFTLQKTYENSSTYGHAAQIDLLPGRDFVIDAPNAPGISFKIDATTGAVTIGGDLYVGGTHTVVNSTTYQSDNLRLFAQSPTTPALWIGPSNTQNTPTVDPFIVSLVPGSSTESVLRVGVDGVTSISSLHVLGDIAVDGKVDGVDIADLAAKFNSHIFVNGTYKHLAKEINIEPGSFASLPIRNVQTVLEYLDNSINNIDAQVQGLHQDVDNLQQQINDIESGNTNGPSGFTFVVEEPMSEWVIEHNKNSKNLMFMVFDESGFMFQPDSAQLVDNNTLIIRFGSAQAGRVNMIFYTTNLF